MVTCLQPKMSNTLLKFHNKLGAKNKEKIIHGLKKSIVMFHMCFLGFL